MESFTLPISIIKGFNDLASGMSWGITFYRAIQRLSFQVGLFMNHGPGLSQVTNMKARLINLPVVYSCLITYLIPPLNKQAMDWKPLKHLKNAVAHH